jgi:hypothetical protein
MSPSNEEPDTTTVHTLQSPDHSTRRSNTIDASLQEKVKLAANTMAATIKKHYNLDPITSKREPCDEENAWYDPETQTITVCDEMIAALQAFAAAEDPENQEQVSINSVLFFYLHELGHAYIDILGIPVTGREEDVADQVASYFILTLQGDAAFDSLVDGAYSFYQFSEQDPEIDDDKLADIHALDKQRYYNILCRLYGATEEQSIIDDMTLPEERAEGCAEEYQLMKESLDILLNE